MMVIFLLKEASPLRGRLQAAVERGVRPAITGYDPGVQSPWVLGFWESWPGVQTQVHILRYHGVLVMLGRVTGSTMVRSPSVAITASAITSINSSINSSLQPLPLALNPKNKIPNPQGFPWRGEHALTKSPTPRPRKNIRHSIDPLRFLFMLRFHDSSQRKPPKTLNPKPQTPYLESPKPNTLSR